MIRKGHVETLVESPESGCTLRLPDFLSSSPFFRSSLLFLSPSITTVHPSSPVPRQRPTEDISPLIMINFARRANGPRCQELPRRRGSAIRVCNEYSQRECVVTSRERHPGDSFVVLLILVWTLCVHSSAGLAVNAHNKARRRDGC